MPTGQAICPARTPNQRRFAPGARSQCRRSQARRRGSRPPPRRLPGHPTTPTTRMHPEGLEGGLSTSGPPADPAANRPRKVAELVRCANDTPATGIRFQLTTAERARHRVARRAGAQGDCCPRHSGGQHFPLCASAAAGFQTSALEESSRGEVAHSDHCSRREAFADAGASKRSKRLSPPRRA